MAEPPADAVSQEASHGRVSVHECQAIRHLRIDGWTVGQLGLALQRKDETILRHANEDCSHPESRPPDRDEIPSIEPYEVELIRKDAGLTQQEFADKIGVTPAAVSGWETGRTNPTEQHVRQVLTLAEADGDA